MIKQLLFFSFFYLAFVLTLNAQVVDPDEVFVKSWKKGEEKVPDQTIQVVLSQKKVGFEKEISAISGKKYCLRILKNPDKSLKGEHWRVQLREITLDENHKEALSEDLLFNDKPGDTGRHVFPREDLAGIFYPYREKKIAAGGIPLIEWKAFYPTKTKRKFLVDGFFVVVKSGSVEFDEKDKTKIQTFELNIEFKNADNY